MTDYTKLVKELRGCKYIDYCKDCPRMAANGYVEICNIKDDAAAAIKELEAENNAIQGELDALRVFTDEAQRQIESLEPKLGEWIRKDAELYYWHECSKCGERPLYDRYANKVLSAYCPNCGAKMTGEQDVE